MKKHLLSLLLIGWGTSFAFASVNYILNESFESGIPATWTQQVLSANTANWAVDDATTYPYGAFDGVQRVALRNSTNRLQGYVTRLITPELNLSSVYSPVLEFAYAQPNYSGFHDTLLVYYRTGDNTSWILLQRYNDVQNEWKQIQLPLIATGGASKYQLAFEAREHMGRGVVLDAIRVFPSSQCAPSVISSIVAYSHSATIGWSGDFGRQNEVLVHNEPIADMDAFDKSQALFYQSGVTLHRQTVTGLDELTNYYAYVRSDCDDNESGYTEWSSKTFITSCGYPVQPSFVSELPNAWLNVYGPLDAAFDDLEDNKSSYKWEITSRDAMFTGAHLTARAYYSYSEGYYPSWLITPPIDLSGIAESESVGVSFRLALSTTQTGTTEVADKTGIELRVLISDDNAESWSVLETVAAENLSAVPQSINIDISDYKDAVIRVALVAIQPNSNAYFHVDGLRIAEYDPACAGLKGLVITPESNGAKLRWSVRGTNNNAIVIVHSRANLSDTIQTISVSSPSATITGLEAKTTYYVSVRQDCETTDRLVGSFTTPCDIETIPYTNNFDEEANNSMPSCWSLYQPGTSSSSYPCVYNSSSVAHSGAKMFTWGEGYTSSKQYNSWVCLPPMENIAGLELSFWARQLRSLSGENLICDSLIVGVMTDPYDSTTFVPVYGMQPQSTEYEQVYVNFLNYSGQGNYIAFKRQVIGSWVEEYYDWYSTDSVYYYLPFAIDDVTVEPVPTCYRMGALRASALRAHGFTLDFAATNAQQYQLVIADASIDLSNLTDSHIVFTSFFPSNRISIDTTALVANGDYYVYVRGYCGGDDYSAWSPELIVRTQCDAFTVEAFGTEDFSNPNTMECWTTGFRTASTADYDTYNHAERTTTNKYGAYLKLSRENAGTAYADGAYAVTPELDFEGDTIKNFQMTFSAATTSQDAKNLARLTVSVMFEPNDFSTSRTIKEIDLKNAYAADSTGEQYYTVSFADYTGIRGNYGTYIRFEAVEVPTHDSLTYILIDNISFDRADNCAQLMETSVSDITTSSAILHWEQPLKDFIGFEVMTVDYRTKRPDTIASPIFFGATTSNSLEMNGLNPSTQYYAYVRTICAEGDTAKWSNGQTFKTAIGAPFMEPFDEFDEGFLTQGWKAYRGMANADTLVVKNLTESSSELGCYVQTISSTISNMDRQAVRANVYTVSYNSLLVSPLVSMGETEGNMGWQLTFRAAAVPYSADGEVDDANDHFLKIMVSSDGGATYHKVVSWEVGKGDYEYNTIKSEAILGKVDLSDYAGQSISIAFFEGSESASSGSPDTYFWIDSVAIQPYDKSCMGTRSLKLTREGTTMNATWQLNIEPAYTIVQMSDDIDFAHIMFDDTLTNVFSQSFENLEYGSTYYVRIKQDSCAQAEWSTAKLVMPMAPSTLPFFQSFNLSALPSDWTLKKGTPSSVFAGTALTAMSGPSTFGWNYHATSNGLPANHLRINICSSTNGEWLLSPVIDMSELDSTYVAQLSFDFAYTNYNSASGPDADSKQALFVLISEDGGSTWNSTNGWEWSQVDSTMAVRFNLDSIPTTGTHIVLDMSPYLGKEIQIAFAATTTSGDNDFHIANVSLVAIDVNCMTPSALTASAAGDSLFLTWEGDDLKQSLIELSLTDDFAEIALTHSVQSGLADTISGLIPGKKYFARLRQVCDNNKTTDYSNVASAFTDCGRIITTPWVEGFEYLPVGNRTSAAPYCWNLLAANGIGTTKAHYIYVSNSSDYIHSGEHCLYFQATTSDYAYAILPEIDALNERHISFFYAFSAQQSGSFDVGYLTDITDTASFVQVAHLSNSAPYKTPKYASIYLDAIPAEVTDSARLAIRYGAPTSNSAYAGIDDITISALPLARPVEDIVVSEIGMNTAKLTFTAQSAAEKYHVILSDAKLDFLSGLSAQDSTHIIYNDSTVLTNEIALNNLQSASGYYVYVAAICADGQGEWAQGVYFLTECGPVSKLPWTMDFESFETGDFAAYCWTNRHVAGKSSAVAKIASSTTVGNDTKMLQIATMTTGNKVMVTTPQFAIDEADTYELYFDAYRNSKKKPAEGLRVYASLSDTIDETAQLLAFIPYGITYTYEVGDEVIIPTQDAAGMGTYRFTIPMQGDVRILLEYEAAGSGAFYMDNFYLRKIPACDDIKDFAITAITDSSAVVIIDSVATMYHVLVTTAPISPDTLENVPAELIACNVLSQSDTVEVKDLHDLTDYYVYVRTSCGADAFGLWAESKSFTSLCGAITDYPWSEDFSGLTAGDFAEPCWSNTHIQGSASTLFTIVTSTIGNNNSTKLSLPYMSSGNKVALGLPQMNIALANEFYISLDVYRASAASTSRPSEGICIYASANAELDTTTATKLAFIPREYAVVGTNVSAENRTGWYTYSFIIPAEGVQNLFLVGIGAGGAAMYIDNLKVEQLPACHPLTDIDVVASGDSATIAFVGNAPSYQLILASAAINPSYIDSLGGITANVLSIDTVYESVKGWNALSPQTTYYVYLRGLCDEPSAWVSLTFKTACQTVASFPWSMDFEGYSAYSGSSFTYSISSSLSNYAFSEDCWVNEHVVGTGTGTYVFSVFAPTSASVNGNGTQQLVLPDMNSGNQTLLILPSMNIPESNDYYFSLDAYRWATGTTNTDEGVRIFVNSKPSITGATELGFISRNYTVSDGKSVKAESMVGWYTYQFTIPMEGVVYIIIRGESRFGNIQSLDNFLVKRFPTCPAVNDLRVLNTMPTEVDIAFTKTNASSYHLLLLTQQVSNPDAMTHADSLNIVVDELSSQDTIHVPNLSASTQYYAYLRGICSESDSSDWASVTFTTSCIAEPTAFYDFEDEQSRYVIYESNSYGTTYYYMENCWTAIMAEGSYTTYYPYIQSNTSSYTYAYSGESAIRLYSSSSNSIAAVMPLVDADMDTLKLRFMGRAGYEYSSTGYAPYMSSASSSNANAVKVGVLSDPNDLSTFQLLRECQGVATSDDPADDPNGTMFWRQFDVNLEGAEGKYIAFVSDYALTNYFYIDDVQFLRADPCPQPTGLKASGLTTNDVSVSWTKGKADLYQVALIETDTVQKILVGDSVHTSFHNLNASTNYQIAVRAVCDESTFSEWSDPIAFTTDCGALTTLPWSEDFESYSSGDFMAACWSNEHIAGTSSYLFTISSSTSTTVGNATNKLQLPDQQTGNRTLLTLPVIRIPEANNYEFSLDVYRTSYSSIKQNEGIRIYVSTDAVLDTLTATMLAFIPREYTVNGVNAPAVSATGWYNYSFILPIEGDVHIFLLGVSEYGASTHLDNFVVRELPACPDIYGLAVESISTNEATISFTDIEVPEYELVVASAQIDPDSAATSAIGSVVYHETVAANEVLIDKLRSNKEYYVYVRALCDEDEKGAWKYTSFKTLFAVGFPFEETFGTSSLPEYWSRYSGLASSVFSGTALTSSSSGWTMSTNLAGTYHPKLNVYGTGCQYWLVSPSIPLPDAVDGIGYELTFDVALTAFGNANAPSVSNVSDDKFIVAISTDDGATWSSANATVWAGDGSGDYDYKALSNSLQSFSIDLSAYAGMSIKIGFYGESTSAGGDNDLHVTNISVHDINANCKKVSGLQVSNVNMSGADVSFRYGAEGAQNAIILLTHENEPDYSTAVLVDTIYGDSIYRIPSLEASSAYNIFVNRICGDDGLAGWVKTTFRTAYGVRFESHFEQSNALTDWYVYTGALVGSSATLTTGSGWSITTTTNVIGSADAKANIYGTSSNKWLVTPALDLSGNVGDGLLLSFEAALTHYNNREAAYGDSSDDRFVVLVSTDNCRTWTILSEWNNSGTGDYVYDDLTNVGTPFYLNMSNFAGQANVHIAFYGESTQSGADNDLHIGNVVLERCSSQLFTARVCDGDSYNGAADAIPNPFRIDPVDYVHGMNVFSEYHPAAQGGVDSMLVLNLMVDTVIYHQYETSICEGEHYQDENFDFIATRNTYEQILRLSSSVGCDSVVILNVNVNMALYEDIYDEVVQGDAYVWHGQSYYVQGNYRFDTLSVVTGCDSTVVLHLSVVERTDLDNALTHHLQLNPNPVDIGQPALVLNDFSADELMDADIEVFSASGMLLYKQHGASLPFYIPGQSVSGMHYVRISIGKDVYISPLLVK